MKTHLLLALMLIAWPAHADKKISELTAITNASLSTDDVMPIVDTSATATKKITISELDSRWAQTATATSQAFNLINVGLSASVASNQLTVALKQADGSTDCSTGTSACAVSFRSSTATTGGFSIVSFTAAASVTLGTTDSIGTVASVEFPIWVYLIDGTTDEVCLSRSHFDEHSLQNASALTGGADTTATVLWCTNSHTSKPVRKIGVIYVTWSNPNWGSLTNVATSPKDNGCYHRNGALDVCQEVAELDCDSASTIVRQEGSWVSAIGNVSSGACAVTMAAGVFSAMPYCWGTQSNNTGTPVIIAASASSATASVFDCVTDGGAGCTDYDVTFYCRGTR